MKTLIYYHDDMDGKCSAAIVGKALKDKTEIIYMPLMHDTHVELPKNIWEYWRVYILDFTLPERQMDELCTLFPRTDVIWIEHHISQLVKYETKYSHLEGIRKNGTAACELTWNFMYGKDSKLPLAVKYIADRDVWKIDDENTMFFYEWLTTVNTDPSSCTTWDFLWTGPLNKYIGRGKLLRDVRMSQMKRDITSLGYESEISGHKCLKANYSSFESISDAGHYICDDLGYEVAWIYYNKKNNLGKKVIINSLRSNGDVDVSEIAATYGGGGHKGASGFVEYLDKEKSLLTARDSV